MRTRTVVLVVAVLVVAAAVISLRDRVSLRSEYCEADVAGVRAQVDPEQARWSSLMAAMAQERGLPPRATTIAIATAFQESKIRNIDYGDRDSVGLFQQRPSQGWGSVEQIMDPVYSIGAFYDGLVEVEGYEGLKITVAAQEVQRSGFPEAYAQHEPYARALASSLRGFSPAAFSCQVEATGGGSLDDVADDLAAAFGRVETAGEAGTLTVTVPTEGEPESRSALAWSYAHYLVANAGRLGLGSVAVDGRTWTAEESADGWQGGSTEGAEPPTTVTATLG